MGVNRVWARTKPRGVGIMRRGAWYPAAPIPIENRVSVEVGIRTVFVHRELVELRRSEPGGFSVVRRSLDEPNPARGTRSDLGLTYAVCPRSGTRVRLVNEQNGRLRCPDCGYEDTVLWEDFC
jgi:hypothetical protein